MERSARQQHLPAERWGTGVLKVATLISLAIWGVLLLAEVLFGIVLFEDYLSFFFGWAILFALARGLMNWLVCEG